MLSHWRSSLSQLSSCSRRATRVNRIDAYFTAESGRPPPHGAERDLDRFQTWLDSHHLKRREDPERRAQKFLDSIGTKDVEKYTTKALDWAEGAALAVVTLLFDVVLIVVVSIYMLLDMQRAFVRGRPALPAATGIASR